MDIVWTALLYTVLGLATLVIGLVKLFLFTIIIGLLVFVFGIYWSYKSSKKQGELQGW